MPKQTAADIDAAASAWVVREDRATLNPAEQAELDAWLAADERRQGAYVRAHAAWSMMDRGRALGA
jgi:transmembrane sensor